MQTLNLISTLIASGSARPSEIVVHIAGDRNDGFVAALRKLEVALQRVDRFGDGDAAYCNKLQQIPALQLRGCDIVVLCDTDVAFAADIRPWLLPDAVRARVVDLPNPPLENLERLYRRTGITALPKLVPTAFAPAMTFETNCNGGLYVIPARWLDSLGAAWRRWSQEALSDREILGPFRKHADQIGFCLAMLALGLPFKPLPASLNFPTHLPSEVLVPRDDVDPLILHYHWRTDPSGFLLPCGAPRVDAVISRINDTLREFRQRHFVSEVFWDYRYAHHPELGSGVGSRGDALEYRRALLCPIISEFAKREILDVGCGDLEVLASASADRYLGLDTSLEAIAVARAKRPDWTFLAGDISVLEGRLFDLVLCGSVLIHIPEREAYLGLVSHLVDRCRDTLVIEAYDAPPVLTSEITFFHEPVSDSLAREPRVRDVQFIGNYRDLKVFRARVR